MTQQIGYLVSLVFAILGGLFFLLSIFYGYKYYFQVPFDNKTELWFFYLAILSVGIALFVFLTTETGFAWENLYLSAVLVIVVSIGFTFSYYMRKKAKIYLAKRNALNPLLPMTELYNILVKVFSAKRDSGINKDNNDKE